jgi:chromosome segregation ATPase
VRSKQIAHEVEELERELSSLHARLDDDDSSFTSLEQQIAELRGRLTETRDGVRMHELRLAEKRVELVAAERLEHLEAYADDVEKCREARKRVADAATGFLAELEAYDGEVVSLRHLLDEMRATLGADDKGVAEVEAALSEESQELSGSWQAVVDAAKWRIAKPPQPENTASESNGGDLAEVLQKHAEDRRVSRVLEYFTKS